MKNYDVKKTREEIKIMVENTQSFYSYEEYKISASTMNKLIKEFNLPTLGSFLNHNSLLMTKIVFFQMTMLMSNSIVIQDQDI